MVCPPPDQNVPWLSPVKTTPVVVPSAYREDLGEVELGEEEALGLHQGVGLEAAQRPLQVGHGAGVPPAHTQVAPQQAGVAHQGAKGDAQRRYGDLQSTGG